MAAARIGQGKQDKLYLRNLSALRDWGYAKDYVECKGIILQKEKPEDYVTATGQQHSAHEFVALAYHYTGLELAWQGERLEKKEIDIVTVKLLEEVFPGFYHLTDVMNFLSNPSEAKKELGGNPTRTCFEELMFLMIVHDLKMVSLEQR